MALVVLLLSDHNDLKVVGGGERGIDVVEGIGVPIRHRGDVILKRQVSALASSAECLNRYAEIFVEVDGILNVPTIHIEISLRDIGFCRMRYL